MRRLRPLVAALALLLLVAAPAAAQTDPDTIVVSATPVVAEGERGPQVTVTVVAPAALAGQPLDSTAFRLTEDGQPRPVRTERLPGDEQTVVLAVDVSGGMAGDPLAAARSAAADFVAQVQDGVRVALLAVGPVPELRVPPTTDTDALLAGIAGLTAGGGTALRDGVGAALDVLAAEPVDSRSLVLLSDGADTASTLTDEAVAERLAGSGVDVTAVALTSPDTDLAALTALAAGAPGSEVLAGDAAGLRRLYAGLAAETGNRYTLTYTPTGDGETEVVVTVETEQLRASTEPVTVGLDAAAPAPPAPSGDGGAGLGVLGGPLALAGGLLACYAALAAIVRAVTRAGPPRLARERRRLDALPDPSALAGMSESVVRGLEEALKDNGVGVRVRRLLDDADVRMPAGQLALLVGSAALALAAVGLLLAGPVVAVLGALVPVPATRVYLSMQAGRRRARFADQLGDALQMVASSLRAGHSLLRALDAVAREAEAPTSVELARVVNEARLGRDLGDALERTAARMQSEDFRWVAQAVGIHREVGGNLADVLDGVAGTIRERAQIKRQVTALAAEGKLSAWVLMALPLGIFAFLFTTNRSYVAGFGASLLGIAMLVVAGVLLVVGGLWLRSTVRITF